MPSRLRANSRLFSLILLGALASSCSAIASGTYPPAPPRLRSDVVRSIDPEAYNLGKSIYNGRANLAASGARASAATSANEQRISAVVDQIPDRARAKLDVPQLARSLDASGVDALIYYLELRFRLTEGVS